MDRARRLEILDRVAGGESQVRVARELGVGRTTVVRVLVARGRPHRPGTDPGHDLDLRPAQVNDRAVPGHWEAI